MNRLMTTASMHRLSGPRPAWLCAILAIGALVVGCDPQATNDYRGEPLVTLQGQVVSSGALPPLEAAMLWQRGEPPSTDDLELATVAPVQSGFPASFIISLYQPAPQAARRSLMPGEVVFARATAGAIPFGIATTQVGSLPASGNPSYGIDANHWVIFLASNVPVGSLTEWWLGAALHAGYHLIDVAPFNGVCMTADQLNACAAELVARGVADDGSDNPGTARGFCTASYRLAPAYPGEELVLNLGQVGLNNGGCP